MFGLEFILEIFNSNPNQLADELGIRRQSVYDWIKKKKIPDARLKQLSKLFDIPQEYFQLELTEEEMRDIHIMHLERKYDAQIELLQKKRGSISQIFDLNDMNELILNLYKKVILKSESEADMRFKMSLIQNVLNFILESESEREISILWDLVDIMLESNKKFIDELENLTGKYS